MAFVGGIGGVFSALGAVVGAVGAIQQANAAAAAAEFNAKLAERDAQIAAQKAALEAEQVDEAGRRRTATIRANIGASGLDVQGSPLAILAESEAKREQDRLNTAAFGATNVQSAQLDAQRERLAGKAAKRSGTFNAVGSLLGGVGSIIRLA